MQRYIDINVFDEEIKASYFDNQKEDLPVLLFIHGNSSSKETFKNQLIEFDKHYRVIAPDLPGHGDSSKLTKNKYSLNILNEFLLSFIKALGLEVHCLLGHSLGGHISLQGLNQIKPLKTILWGTPPMTNPPIMEKLFLGNPLANLFFQEKVKTEELYSLYEECFEEYSTVSKSEFVETFIKTDPKFRIELITELGSLDYLDELSELEEYRGDVLFVLGENERIISNEYIRHNCLDHFQSQSKGGSHFMHNDMPDTFNFIVLSHLQQFTFDPTRLTMEL